MLTEQQITQLIERFFEIMGEEQLTVEQELEAGAIINQLGWTEADLRDIAALCQRRAIYLSNTTHNTVH